MSILWDWNSPARSVWKGATKEHEPTQKDVSCKIRAISWFRLVSSLSTVFGQYLDLHVERTGIIFEVAFVDPEE